MKTKFIKIDKSCSENWNKMPKNKRGSFCDVCSTTVVDFTELASEEILKQLKQSGGNVCARVSQTQLNTPLIDFKEQTSRNLIPIKTVASVLIAGSLLSVQPAISSNSIENNIKSTQLLNSNSVYSACVESEPSLSHVKSENLTEFKGKIIDSKDSIAIENAKIIFFTLKKTYIVYSKKDGSFSIEIPSELIDNDNVVRVYYDKIVSKNNLENFEYYKTSNYILTKSQINDNYTISAYRNLMMLGGISVYYENKNNPIVLNNGIEVKYKDFIKAREGKKSKCNLDDKDFYYFDSKFAIALYGEKAKYGLYLFVNN